jgi:hypothetical protein
MHPQALRLHNGHDPHWSLFIFEKEEKKRKNGINKIIIKNKDVPNRILIPNTSKTHGKEPVHNSPRRLRKQTNLTFSLQRHF